MRNEFWAVMLATSSLLMGTEVRSDQSIRVLGGSNNNLRYSQYEIIENHPACNGPDEIALSVPLRIDELDYAILDPTNNKAIFGIDQVYRECTTTTMRGTERVERPIPCSDELDLDTDDRLTNAPLSIKFAGDVLACLSPSNIQVLETSWAISSESETEIEGHTASISASSETIDRTSDLDKIITTSVEIDYIDRFFTGYVWSRSYRDHEVIQALQNHAMIFIRADCIPLISTLPEPIFIEFRARFIPVNEVKQTCTAADCPVSLGLDKYRDPRRTGDGDVRLSGRGGLVGQHCLRQ